MASKIKARTTYKHLAANHSEINFGKCYSGDLPEWLAISAALTRTPGAVQRLLYRKK
jgi:hypothetical protein